MRFEVYTYFGRVLYTFKIEDNELHHEALEKARVACRDFNGRGVKAWVRLARR